MKEKSEIFLVSGIRYPVSGNVAHRGARAGEFLWN